MDQNMPLRQTHDVIFMEFLKIFKLHLLYLKINFKALRNFDAFSNKNSLIFTSNSKNLLILIPFTD